MSAVQIVCVVIVVIATTIGIAVFARACFTIGARMAVGRATAPQRLRPVGRRLALTLGALVGHTAFKGRPFIKAAHWLVMVSFPLLFLTLVAGYGQVLGGPDFALPLIGHAAWWAWIVELIAWLSTFGIVGLTILRWRLTRAGRAAPPYAPDSDGGKRPRTSRFAGSTSAQAKFVEATIIGVVACVLALRMLEHAHLAASPDPAQQALASWTHFPLTAWTGPLLAPASAGALANAILIVATIKVVLSMTWFVVVGLQPSMGVAWHRFLAILNVYARREVDGSKALGPLQPLMVGDEPLTEATMDTLEEAMEAADSGEGPEVRLGVGRIEDFTWKGLLDFSTCTECGRCQDLCPAWNTGKPLSPKLFVMALRDHHAAAAPYLRAASALGVEPDDVTEEMVASRPTSGGLVGKALGMHDGLARETNLGLEPGTAHTGDCWRPRRPPPRRAWPRGRRPWPGRSSPPTSCGPAPPAGPAWTSARWTSSTSITSSMCAASRCSWSRPSPRSSAACSARWSPRGTRGGCRRASAWTGPRTWTSRCRSSATTSRAPRTSTTCSGWVAPAPTRTGPRRRRGRWPSCCTPRG